jgi:flagellum-specific peptidoglycan hydrolase FlgJ
MTLDQQIYNAAINEGYSPTTAKIIVAQARLESGNYSSPVYKKNNNLFGMKFVAQPLAQQGSLAPYNERSESCKKDNVCGNKDHYAKYSSPTDSIRDLIGRLYKKERNGIGYEQLRNVSDEYEFARRLKQRDYYGISAEEYGRGLNARLKLVSVTPYSGGIMGGVTNYTKIALVLIGTTIVSYYLYKKYVK